MRVAHFEVSASCCVILLLLACAVTPCQVTSAWQVEIVDNSRGKNAGAFSSLAIDRFGNLHLVYSRSGGNALQYAFCTKTDKRWDKAVIDPTGGSYGTIAVDSKGRAHIAYNSFKVVGLHYAEWDGTQWQKAIIDPVHTTRETSIQLDSQDNPRITYFRERYADGRTAQSLKYAYFDGKTWFLQTVDHRYGSGGWNALALDRQDRPNISYSTASGFLGFTSLVQRSPAGSSWDHGSVDFQSAKGRRFLDTDSSLAIGSDDLPYVAFINAADRTINYAWKEGDSWHRETVDTLVATGGDSDQVSLKLDKRGNAHLAYSDSGLGKLKYAVRDKSGWHTETVDDSNAGLYASLCLGADGDPYISYYATSSWELRIAHRESSEPSPAK